MFRLKYKNHHQTKLGNQIKVIIKFTVRGLSGKYPAILNISRNGRVTLM